MNEQMLTVQNIFWQVLCWLLLHWKLRGKRKTERESELEKDLRNEDVLFKTTELWLWEAEWKKKQMSDDEWKYYSGNQNRKLKMSDCNQKWRKYSRRDHD